jgi:hypothetical protein
MQPAFLTVVANALAERLRNDLTITVIKETEFCSDQFGALFDGFP